MELDDLPLSLPVLEASRELVLVTGVDQAYVGDRLVFEPGSPFYAQTRFIPRDLQARGDRGARVQR